MSRFKDFFRNSATNPVVADQTTPFEGALAAMRHVLVWAGLFSLLLNMLQLTIPLYMMQMLDRIMLSANHASLYLLTFIAIMALSVSMLLDLMRAKMLNRAASWLEKRLSLPLFPYVVLACHRGKPDHACGFEELWRLRSFLSSPAMLALFDLPWMVFYIAVLYILAVPIGVMATLGILVLLGIAARGELIVRRQLDPSNRTTRDAREYIHAVRLGAAEYSALGMLDNIAARWLGLNMQALKGQYLSTNHGITNLAVFKYARLLLQLMTLFTGGLLVLSGDLSIGAVIGASIIMSRALAPVEQAISSWKQALSSLTAYGRLKNIWTHEEQTGPAQFVSGPSAPAALQLHSVTFHFPGASHPAIVDLSLNAHPGELLAIIGASGAGKSVIVQLMAGAFKPGAGRIQYGDYDIQDYDPEAFGAHLGYVAQHSRFLPGSIRDNIARFRSSSAEMVMEAAQRIGAHDFIEALPGRYDTIIAAPGAHGLSGGELQRLAIARAIAGRPGLLVMDEPNLNLDEAAQNRLLAILAEETARGTTCVVATHQRSVIERADKLAVIEHGHLRHYGPRAAVLQQIEGTHPARLVRRAAP